MGGHFGNGDRMRLFPSPFAQGMPASDVNGRTRAKVRQGKVNPTVSAKSSTQKGKQSLVLVNWQELPIGKRPPFRSKIEAHDAYFRKKWFSHSVRKVYSEIFKPQLWSVAYALK
jgi:hypothetical protein